MSKVLQKIRPKGKFTKSEPGALVCASSPYMLQPEVPLNLTFKAVSKLTFWKIFSDAMTLE